MSAPQRMAALRVAMATMHTLGTHILTLEAEQEGDQIDLLLTHLITELTRQLEQIKQEPAPPPPRPCSPRSTHDGLPF